jgi:hypothetical protein
MDYTMVKMHKYLVLSISRNTIHGFGRWRQHGLLQRSPLNGNGADSVKTHHESARNRQSLCIAIGMFIDYE